MHLKNVTMQLRKVACHPFAFDWPIDPVTREYVVNEELVDASGKMMMLERLLEELFKRGHRVLLFSQFTTMLDIIEDWAVEFKRWDICRIDGSTSPDDRRAQMDRFNGANAEPRLFLLSTRAGGLGINLVSADTVIFYDQDWVSLLFFIDTRADVCDCAESANGPPGPGQSASHRADQARSHFPVRAQRRERASLISTCAALYHRTPSRPRSWREQAKSANSRLSLLRKVTVVTRCVF